MEMRGARKRDSSPVVVISGAS